jgi:hypothetical protein
MILYSKKLIFLKNQYAKSLILFQITRLWADLDFLASETKLFITFFFGLERSKSLVYYINTSNPSEFITNCRTGP